jgi:nitrogen-specific signal transduction histidine kinase
MIAAKHYKDLEITDVGLPPSEDRIVGNDQPMLNEISAVLYQLKTDGFYDKIYKKWFTEKSYYISRYIYLTFIFLVLIGITLTTFVYLLKAKVRKAQRLVSNKSESLTLALNASDIGVWGYDIKKKQFYNIERSFFVRSGVDLNEGINYIHPDDRPQFLANMKALCDGSCFVHPRFYRMRKSPEHSWQYIEIRSETVMDKSGDIEKIVGTNKDITEKHTLEEAIKKNVKRIDMAIHASNMTLWEVNSKTLTVKCYNSHNKELEGRDTPLSLLFEYAHPDELQKAMPFIEMVKQGKDAIIETEILMKFPYDDKWHNCKITGKAFDKDEDSETVLSYVGFSIDVTPFIEIQHNLEIEKEKAQAADRLKSDFLANMSHEIRTPLNAIVGFAGVMKDLTDENDKDECYKTIDTNCRVLLNLINDILDLSKIEAGEMEISNRTMDISEIFNDAFITLRNLNQNKNVEFINEIPYKSCIIYADPNRTLQIITNFVTNAFKYTQSGYVKMGYAAENHGIKIIVEDTGIGIPAEKQEVVFARFEKLGSLIQGTGLGLAICKAIIERCNGKIGVKSTVGKGSTFWAWFPTDVEIIQ